MHRYYDRCATRAATSNYAKREQWADLDGHYALVTGARVKIGFQRPSNFCAPVRTSSSPRAFQSTRPTGYSKEADFSAFRERLQIHGLDLRHTPSVELFTRFTGRAGCRGSTTFSITRDQTVRRPAGFLPASLARESESVAALPEAWRAPLASHDELRRTLEGSHTHASGTVIAAAARRARRGAPAQRGALAAALSQMRTIATGETLFPTDRYDQDRQQVDLREVQQLAAAPATRSRRRSCSRCSS